MAVGEGKKCLLLVAILLLSCLEASLGSTSTETRGHIRYSIERFRSKVRKLFSNQDYERTVVRRRILVDATPSVCPSTPLDLCDFFFTGFSDTIPVFWNLSSFPVDVPISTAVTSARSPGNQVSVNSNGNVTFLCPADGVTSGGNQLYLTGSPSKLQIRNFNRAYPASLFNSRCILLPIISAQVVAADSTVYNLSPGDGFSSLFPSARRCIIVKTGPNPPPESNCGGASTSGTNPPPPSPRVTSSPPPATPPPKAVNNPPVSAPAPAPSPASSTAGTGNGPAPAPGPLMPDSMAPAPTPLASSFAPVCNSCPSSPNDTCDFYFEGYEDSLPTFHLSQLFSSSPQLPASVKCVGLPPQLAVNVTALNVVGSQLMMCPNRAINLTLPGAVAAAQVVAQQVGQLLRGALTAGKAIALVDNSCVKVAIGAATISVEGVEGNSTASDVVALKPNDGNPRFPQSRRCLVFHLAL